VEQLSLLKFSDGKMIKRIIGATIPFDRLTKEFGDVTAVDEKW